MKFIEEYRNPAAAHALADELARTITRPWTLMEVLGTKDNGTVLPDLKLAAMLRCRVRLG